MMLADPAIPRRRPRRARAAVGRARAAADAGLQLDHPHRRRARRGRAARRRADLGSRWPTAKPELVARIARGGGRRRPGGVGRARGQRRPVPQPRLPRPCSKRRAASATRPAGPRCRSSPSATARSSPPRRPISRATARANMSSTMAGPRRGSAAGRLITPSCRSPCRSRRCPGGACSATARAILAALEAVTVQNGLSSAHVTFCDAGDLEAGEARGWLRRDGIQYHWFNRGYAELRRLPRPRCRAASARRSARSAPRRARGSTSSRCAAPRSARRTWRRCGTSTRTPAAANGASPI